MVIKHIFRILLLAFFTISCNSKSENQDDTRDTLLSLDNKNFANDTVSGQKVIDNWLIVPGVSAGQTKINEDAELVFKQLGKPDGGDAAMGKAVAIWYAKHDPADHSTAIYTVRDMGNNPEALVKQIRITSPAFKTKDGLGPKSDLTEIQKSLM